MTARDPKSLATNLPNHPTYEATYMVCRGATRAGHNSWLNRLTSAPNVSSATARLRAFSGGYRDSFRLTVVSHPKARSRPASAYRPSRRHVGGGTGSKDGLPATTTPGRLRTICERTGLWNASIGCRKKRRRPTLCHGCGGLINTIIWRLLAIRIKTFLIPSDFRDLNYEPFRS